MSLPPANSETIHASAVAINGRAVLIVGQSGAGKSDLALRLIDRGAVLISDDYTNIRRTKDTLTASPPPTIVGQIEVRGIGIIEMPHVSDIPVGLIVGIAATVDRMPEVVTTRRVAGLEVPVFPLVAFEVSAPIKIELALHRLGLQQP